MQKMNGFLRFLMAVFFLFCFVPSSFSATVDVMIVYDSTAKSWVDSNGGMNAFCRRCCGQDESGNSQQRRESDIQTGARGGGLLYASVW